MARRANRLENSHSGKMYARRLDEDHKLFTNANTIRSAGMIIVAPLAAGAYQVSMLISAGNYTSAVKCAVISSICFLILASSTSLADIVRRLLEGWLDKLSGR
jgi:hypothetical protein